MRHPIFWPVIVWAVTFVCFLGIDSIWLTTMVGRLYRPRLGPLLLDKPLLGVALGFYALYAVGIVVFAVMPGLREGALRAAWGGALFGVIAYATYDLTNWATLRGWPASLTFIDMAWGLVVTAAAASLARFVLARFG